MILRRSLDRFGVVAAVLFAAPTLTYPLGRDLALFLYVGREWLRGALPYRDTYDFKPPGIFIVNALTVALFGENQWGIHIVDIAAIVTMAWVVTQAVGRDRPRARGELAAVALVTAGFYYTTFDFIELAQTELGESLAIIAAYAVAMRTRRVDRAAPLAGVLCGVGIVFKPTALLLSLVPLVVLAVRTARPGVGRARIVALVRTLTSFAVAALAVGALVAGYFIVRGGFDAMIDMLVRHVWDYHANAKHQPMTLEWLRKKAHGEPWPFVILGAWVFAVVAAWRRRSWVSLGGSACAFGFVVLCVIAVVYQRRLLGYYWVVLTPFLALAAGQAVAEIRRPALAVAGAIGAIWLGLTVPRELPRPYLEMAKSFVKYVRGAETREEYLAPFEEYPEEERLAKVLRARARPGDTLMVRGYEPAIYVVSGLRCPSRFAVEIPFTTEGMTYKREEWRAEHERDAWNARVRFVVTFAGATNDLEEIRARGYHEVARSDYQVALERND